MDFILKILDLYNYMDNLIINLINIMVKQDEKFIVID